MQKKLNFTKYLLIMRRVRNPGIYIYIYIYFFFLTEQNSIEKMFLKIEKNKELEICSYR